MTRKRQFQVRGLGEIAIRCADLDRMVAFYRDVIGLAPLEGGHRNNIVFFRVAEGVGGHTAVLALFQADPRDAGQVVAGTTSSLHHIALSLPFSEQDAVIDWYERSGIEYRIERFGWIGWCGIFTQDPEGNTVELVAYDPSMRD